MTKLQVGSMVEVVSDNFAAVRSSSKAVGSHVGEQGTVAMILSDGLIIVDMPQYNNALRYVSFYRRELKVITKP